MTSKDEEFLKRLLETFRQEAQDSVRMISTSLVKLESISEVELRTEILEIVFREAHSLKGAARAVDLYEIETISHSLESVFSSLKLGRIDLSRSLFDVLHTAVDTIDNLVMSMSVERTDVSKSEIADLVSKLKGDLKQLLEDESDVKPASIEVSKSPDEKAVDIKRRTHLRDVSDSSDTMKISYVRLNSIFLKAEEMLSAKLSAEQFLLEIREVMAELRVMDNEFKKIRPDMRRMRAATPFNVSGSHGYSQVQDDYSARRVSEYLEWSYSNMKAIQYRLNLLSNLTTSSNHSFSGMLVNLLDGMKQALMLPFSVLLEVLPKVVRDLSRDLGKEVDLQIIGGDIEIDRRILDELKTPLIHIIRNCIDYGIEKKDVRLRCNKGERGLIKIEVIKNDSSNVNMFISDDGAGIDLEAVKSAALDKGVITQEEFDSCSASDAQDLVFRSGLSTSPIITDISGRGLGLAIVRDKIAGLRGQVFIDSTRGKGTKFHFILPTTISTFRSILFRVGEYAYALTTADIECVARFNRSQVFVLESNDTVSHNGCSIPLVKLGDVIGVSHKEASLEGGKYFLAFIAGTPDRRVAFAVDEIINEQEILVKGLGKQLVSVPLVAGAAVLGSGKVVPILNVRALLKAALKGPRNGKGAFTPAVDEADRKRTSVVIVEDSITSRTLMKNIMSSAGYRVRTAVDGVDALTMLKTEPADIIISDVEMPRMDGFELTRQVRSNRHLKEIPIILVTALESMTDRERGVEAGANAYIVKSNFDQSNLLDIVQRLI
ncbi:MAG: response regulator [Nitrospira sp.]|nr:response regulator [Nitrospira sp.]